MTVSLTTTGTDLSAATPIELFRTSLYGDVYASASDGKRFLIARPVASGDVVPLEIVVNPLR